MACISIFALFGMMYYGMKLWTVQKYILNKTPDIEILPKLLRWGSPGFGFPYTLLVTLMTMATQKQTLANFIVMCLLFEWFFIFSLDFFRGSQNDIRTLLIITSQRVMQVVVLGNNFMIYHHKNSNLPLSFASTKNYRQ